MSVGETKAKKKKRQGENWKSNERKDSPKQDQREMKVKEKSFNNWCSQQQQKIELLAHDVYDTMATQGFEA